MDEEKQLRTPPPPDASEHASLKADNVARITERSKDLFSTVDMRAQVIFWLVLAMLVILFLRWAPGQARTVATGVGGRHLAHSIVLPLLFAMLNPYVLLTVAMVISVYARAVNLGVWGVALFSYAIASHGDSPVSIAAILAGLIVFFACIGALVGRLACTKRYLAVVASLFVGIGCNFAAINFIEIRPVVSGFITSPLGMMLVVLVMYLLALPAVVWIHSLINGTRRPSSGDVDGVDKKIPDGNCRVTSYLVGSFVVAAIGGALAGLGGLGIGSTNLVLGDLRVAAAALIALCLVSFKRGFAGCMVSCALAPLGVLVATMWMQCVGFGWVSLDASLELGVFVLTVSGVRLIVYGRGYRLWRRGSAALAACGVLCMAISCYWPFEVRGTEYALAGLCLWALGFVAGVARLATLLVGPSGND